jgi:hypothetical protein
MFVFVCTIQQYALVLILANQERNNNKSYTLGILDYVFV